MFVGFVAVSAPQCQMYVTVLVPRGPPQSTGTCDLRQFNITLQSSKRGVQRESQHPYLMISIVDNTAEQASEFGIHTQLNLHRSTVSTLLLQPMYLLFVCPNQTSSLNSSGLTEEKLSTGFPQMPYCSRTV